MRKSKLTERSIIEAHTAYINDRLSLQDIGMHYGITGQAMGGLFNRRNLFIRNNSEAHRDYDVSHHFFNTIDTEEKAYWLGFILADGAIHKNTLAIVLDSKDVKHVDKFAHDIGSCKAAKIYKYEYKPSFARFAIDSKEIISDLFNLGIGERKSLTVCPPKIPENLERHFWRGVIDGDGCICIPKISRNVYVRLVGSKQTCDMFSSWVNYNMGIKSTVHPHKSIFSIGVYGKNQVRELVALLYQDANVFLDRKAELAHVIMNNGARNIAAFAEVLTPARGVVNRPNVHSGSPV